MELIRTGAPERAMNAYAVYASEGATKAVLSFPMIRMKSSYSRGSRGRRYSTFFGIVLSYRPPWQCTVSLKLTLGSCVQMLTM